MFYLSMAGLTAAVHNQHELIERECADYLIGPTAQIDLDVTPTGAELRDIKQHFRDLWKLDLSDAQAEENAIFRQLYGALPEFGRFWIHSCLVGLDGQGYAFCAPSGTGKTTHSRLWLKEFGSRAQIVNGDAPVISREGDTYYAWGTPFCGKERYQVNTHVPLRGLAFIHRGETNSIEPLSPSAAFGYMVADHRLWINPSNQERYLTLLQQFVETVPLYRLTANMDQEAARVSSAAMSQGALVS